MLFYICSLQLNIQFCSDYCWPDGGKFLHVYIKMLSFKTRKRIYIKKEAYISWVNIPLQHRMLIRCRRRAPERIRVTSCHYDYVPGDFVPLYWWLRATYIFIGENINDSFWLCLNNFPFNKRLNYNNINNILQQFCDIFIKQWNKFVKT